MTAPDDVIARIVSVGATDAAATVLALPAAQARAVLATLGPAQAARLLVGVRVDRTADLTTIIGPALLPVVLAQLTLPQLADLVSDVPFDLALRIVGQLPPSRMEELLLELPTQQRTVLLGAMRPSQGGDAGVADYVHRVQRSLTRMASWVSWLDPAAGTLIAEVFGRPIQVAVRYRAAGGLADADLHAVVRATDWRQVAALVLLTNTDPVGTLGPALRDLVRQGYPIDVLKWIDEGDDGELKRTLVRLSRPPQ